MRRDYGFGDLGRPPFAPLARAAAALASDLTLPPLRPNKTAAGFLRGIASDRQRTGAQGLANGIRRHFGVPASTGVAGARRHDGGGDAEAFGSGFRRAPRAEREAVGVVAVAGVLHLIHGREHG